MINDIAKFVLKKGFDIDLNFDITEIVNYFIDIMKTDHTDTEIIEIQRMLGALIDAPYKNAVEFLRLGEKEKARDQLIDAISKNEFDLPARLLYIELLIGENRLDIAMEKYWDILDMFGIREDIVPECIVALYREYMKKCTTINKPIRICNGCWGHGFYSELRHTKFMISQHAFVIQWNYPPNKLNFIERRLIKKLNYIRAYNIITGNNLFDVEGTTESTILSLTNKYIVINLSGVIRLYDSKTGKQLDKIISQGEYTQLFVNSETGQPCSYFGEMTLYSESIGTMIPNITFDLEACEHTESDTNYAGDFSTYSERTYYAEAIIISSSVKALAQ